jgi:hypothetical protein
VVEQAALVAGREIEGIATVLSPVMGVPASTVGRRGLVWLAHRKNKG